MPSLDKALRRDRKRNKLILNIFPENKSSIRTAKIKKKQRDLEWKKRREEKEALLESD
jgi:hypothetical protein